MNSINPHSREREAIASAQALPLSVPTLPTTEIGPVAPPPVPPTERVRRPLPRGTGIFALLLGLVIAEQTFPYDWCQQAFKRNPLSACKRDPCL